MGVGTVIELDVQKNGNRNIIDLRPIILAGKHPRQEVFNYVRDADVGTIFEIHTPKLTNPLIKGLEDMGFNVIVDELESTHFRIVTVKLNEL